MASSPTTTNCTYHSITLQAGNSFVLPSGATLISATNPGALTSVNGCADDDLANLETPVCYVFRFSGAESDNNPTENWDEPNYRVNGIVVSGVYYPFTTFIGGTNVASSWNTAMNGIIEFSGLFTSFSSVYGDESDNPGAGWTNEIKFSTIPSIGNNLEFQISTTLQMQSPFSGQQAFAYVKGGLCS